MARVADPRQREAIAYMENNFKYGNSAAGYISTAKDAKHLHTPIAIYDGARLDYIPSPFTRDAESVFVIRFKTKNSVNISLPSSSNPYPFTNNGFTAGLNGTLGIPELYSTKSLKFSEAAIFKINKNGTEEVVAVFEYKVNKFTKL